MGFTPAMRWTYVDSDGADIESLAENLSLICEGRAAYHDEVSQQQGNVDLSPTRFTVGWTSQEVLTSPAVSPSFFAVDGETLRLKT